MAKPFTRRGITSINITCGCSRSVTQAPDVDGTFADQIERCVEIAILGLEPALVVFQAAAKNGLGDVAVIRAAPCLCRFQPRTGREMLRPAAYGNNFGGRRGRAALFERCCELLTRSDFGSHLHVVTPQD